MLTVDDIPAIVDKVRCRLEEEASRGVRLEVTESSLEDDWLYIVVTPAEPGVRASDHAELMSRIERELREQNIDNVLLVPTLTE